MTADNLRDELARLNESAFGWAMVCCHRDRDMATEVLQQAFCRILSGNATFAGRSEFTTWVFGVIRHVAHEEYRGRQRRRKLFAGNPEYVQPTLAASSDHPTIDQQELAEQLSLALGKLSERQRAILHLTFYENMTVEQAANVLEITVGSARQHYQRGKASLHRLLAANQELEQ